MFIEAKQEYSSQDHDFFAYEALGSEIYRAWLKTLVQVEPGLVDEDGVTKIPFELTWGLMDHLYGDRWDSQLDPYVEFREGDPGW